MKGGGRGGRGWQAMKKGVEGKGKEWKKGKA